MPGQDEGLDLLHSYGITPEDLETVRKSGIYVKPKIGEMLDRFYEWMRGRSEYEEFFSSEETLSRVRAQQAQHWATFFDGTVSDEYIEARRRVGRTHVQIGLPLGSFFSGTTAFAAIYSSMLRESDLEADEQLEMERALNKLLTLDTAVVVETYYYTATERIQEQSRALLEMSTPVTEIWEGILLLPLVGIIDSKRAMDVMTATLAKIAETQARVFIMDISGVGVVDTAVANHLIKITQATRLMGCESTISGISASIAQTIVELGIDVGSVTTTATMRDALAASFASSGVTIGS